MRCRACNKELNDREACRKYLTIDEFIEMCNGCTDDAGIFRTDKGEATAPVELELPDPYEEVLGG
jgi:hypothetical protein